jgi:hypothetical protein
LEQREGRIQRFGSLSIRQAVAASLGDVIWGQVCPEEGLWRALAAAAEEQHSGLNGLSPWWIFPGAKIQPWFFSLSQSRLGRQIRSMQNERALYRLAIGQPHQEEFIRSLNLRPEDAARYFLQLSPSAALSVRPKRHRCRQGAGR